MPVLFSLKDAWPALLTLLGVIVSSCAWPLTVIVVSIIFYTPLRELLERLSGFSAPGFSAKFNSQLEKVVEVVAEVKQEEPPEAKAVSGAGDSNQHLPTARRLLDLAEVSPRAAVLEAWILVEGALYTKAQELKVNLSPGRTPRILIALFSKTRLLRKEYATALLDLLALRNNAVHAHSGERDISVGSAHTYVLSALSMLHVTNCISKTDEWPGANDPNSLT